MTLDRRRTLRAVELAWVALLPCAVLVLAAIVVLGPLVGRLAFPSGGLTFWESLAQSGQLSPEPTEQGRFLVALSGPLLLSGAVLLGLRHPRRLKPATIERLIVGTQITLVAFAAICVVVQYRQRYQLDAVTLSPHTVYFRISALGAAAVIALALWLGIARPSVRQRFAALTAETPRRRAAVALVAAIAVVLWLLPAINFEKTIVYAHDAIVNHLPFWLDETFAALDGRLPLVGFAAQYGSLWPYPIAGAMELFGTTVGVFTIAMSAISAVAMLAVLAALRRVVRSSVTALLLFLPLMATGFFMMEGPLGNRYAVSNLFGTFPLRYAGPLLLFALVARHLDGAAPSRRVWLFLAAGVVFLNNPEFGLPAAGATVAALLWSGGRPTWTSIGRLLLDAAVGFVAAYALVSVVTLVVAGEMPHLDLLFKYSSLFALGGFGLLPMVPTIGISTIVYLTYVAAIGAATVGAVGRRPDRLLIGLLAWSGVFGLGIGSYYMGRSHPEVLTNMFCAWALSIVLLLVLTVRSLVARAARRPTLAEMACLFAFGVLVCSLAQAPTPWSQVSRLRHTGLAIYDHPPSEPFIAAHAHRGEVVAILTQLGHRAAYNLGLVDVTPYTTLESMPTLDQLVETLDDLQAAGGRKVFLSLREAWPEVPGALEARGYAPVVREQYGAAEFARPR